MFNSRHMSSNHPLVLMAQFCQFEKISCLWPETLVQDHTTCCSQCPLHGFRIAVNRALLPGYLQLYCMYHNYVDYSKRTVNSNNGHEARVSFEERIFVEFPCVEYSVQELIHTLDTLAAIGISMVSIVPVYLDDVMLDMWQCATEVNRYSYGEDSSMPVAVGMFAVSRCISYLSRSPETHLRSKEYRASLIVGPDHRDILERYSKRQIRGCFGIGYGYEPPRHSRLPYAAKSYKSRAAGGSLIFEHSSPEEGGDTLIWEMSSAISDILDDDYLNSSQDEFHVGPSGSYVEGVD